MPSIHRMMTPIARSWVYRLHGLRGGWILSGLLAIAGCSDPAPSAKRILARYFKARGGKERLRKLRSLEVSGKIQLDFENPPQSGSYRSCVIYSDHAAIEIDAGRIRAWEVLRRKKALTCRGGFQSCRLAGAAKAFDLVRAGRESNRELLFESTRWRGAPSVEGDTLGWRLSGRDRRGPVVYWFDKKTGLLRKKARAQFHRIYGNWKNVGGLLIAHSTAHYRGNKRVWAIDLSQASTSVSRWCYSAVTGSKSPPARSPPAKKPGAVHKRLNPNRSPK